jgi:hypothetical protein
MRALQAEGTLRATGISMYLMARQEFAKTSLHSRQEKSQRSTVRNRFCLEGVVALLAADSSAGSDFLRPYTLLPLRAQSV